MLATAIDKSFSGMRNITSDVTKQFDRNGRLHVITSSLIFAVKVAVHAPNISQGIGVAYTT